MNTTIKLLKKDSTAVVILFLTLSAGFFSLAIQNIFMVILCVWALMSKSIDYKRVDLKLFLILSTPFFIGLFFFFENVLQRQLGVMLLAILLPVFIKLEKPQNLDQ